jgi:hypothetical protein
MGKVMGKNTPNPFSTDIKMEDKDGEYQRLNVATTLKLVGR